MRQAFLSEVRDATEVTDEERKTQCIVIAYKYHKHLRHFYDYEKSVLIDGKSVPNIYDTKKYYAMYRAKP
jgi:hypothetical protein